jgi:hypothetical protein
MTSARTLRHSCECMTRPSRKQNGGIPHAEQDCATARFLQLRLQCRDDRKHARDAAYLSPEERAALLFTKFFSKRDDNALGTAEIAESIQVFVLYHLANECGSMLLQTRNHVVDVRDGEHDAMTTERVHR